MVTAAGPHPEAKRGRGQLTCDGTRAETRFRLSAKQRTNPFKSAGASVQSTTGSLVVRISGSNAGYTMFRGSVKSTGYPLHSPVSLSIPLPCVTVCHHVSTVLHPNNPTGQLVQTLPSEKRCTSSCNFKNEGNSISKLQIQVAIYVFELSAGNCHR